MNVLSNHLNLIYVLVAISVERYIMVQTNSDKSKLFIHLYVYFVSNLSKLCTTYLDFVTHLAVRTTSMCLLYLIKCCFHLIHESIYLLLCPHEYSLIIPDPSLWGRYNNCSLIETRCNFRCE